MIVGFDSGFGSKPGPNGLIAICEKFNITPNEAAMVGDTYADFGAAKAAGGGSSLAFPIFTQTVQMP